MPQPDQLAGQTAFPFIADDEMVRELRQIVNALHDLEARIPSLARQAEELLRQLEPREPEAAGV